MAAPRRKSRIECQQPAAEHVAVFSGPNAVDPARMTPDERLAEHVSVRDQHAGLVRRLRGHINYFGVNGNCGSVNGVVWEAERSWRKWLCRRSHRRPGCGKTVGLWFAHVLRNCILTLHALWIFLAGILAGRTRAYAFRRTQTGLHPMAAYRVFRRVERSQTRLRVRLGRQVRAPAPPRSTSPLAATLAHLQEAFRHARCPPAAYQIRFQRAFLA